MQYKIREVARMVGISVRMLHHYDRIGLLVPESVSPAGYRLYSDRDLERLQQILFFKELEFALQEIKSILDTPGFDRKEALRSHRRLLLEKKKRLDKIIGTVERTIGALEGGEKMSKKDLFEGFDMSELQKHKESYAEETRQRYGQTDAYKESEKRMTAYKSEDWASITERGNELFRKLSSLMEKQVGDSEVQETVAQYRQYITDSFYDCTLEIFRGLADLYIQDERFTANIDRYGAGLAQFLREAMIEYCDKYCKQ